MLIRPTDVVDLWHYDGEPNEPPTGAYIQRRQAVREEWPDLGEMLDKLPPADVREPEDDERTIIDVPWYSVIVVVTVVFIAGMWVGKVWL